MGKEKEMPWFEIQQDFFFYNNKVFIKTCFFDKVYHIIKSFQVYQSISDIYIDRYDEFLKQIWFTGVPCAKKKNCWEKKKKRYSGILPKRIIFIDSFFTYQFIDQKSYDGSMIKM